MRAAGSRTTLCTFRGAENRGKLCLTEWNMSMKYIKNEVF